MKLHPGLKSKQEMNQVPETSATVLCLLLYIIILQNILILLMEYLKNYQSYQLVDTTVWVMVDSQISNMEANLHYELPYSTSLQKNTSPPFSEILIQDIKLMIMKQSFDVKYCEYNPLGTQVRLGTLVRLGDC